MEHRQYAAAELEKMTPAQLLEFSFYWNERAGGDEILTNADLELVYHCMDSASQEIEARWGADASDNLAEYFTASHASYEDMVRMARESADLLVELAKGEHDCGAHEGDFSDRSSTVTRDSGIRYSRHACRCGRIWGRINNTYFDPANTTVEEVLASADRN